MTIQTTTVQANNTLPSVDTIDVSGPAFAVTNTDPLTVGYVTSDDSLNQSQGFPVRPGETVVVPVAGTETVYFFAPVSTSTPVRLHVLYYTAV